VIARYGALIVTILLIAADAATAAPADQAVCIYETVPKERLADFGESALAPEDKKQPDLDPLYNAAENACIAQYGWSEVDAANAGRYFITRTTRDHIASIFRENRLDPAKVDRAYASIKGQIADTADSKSKNQQLIIAALQKQAFPVDSAELLDAVFYYVGLQVVEDKALADFIAESNDAD
jgi:hypothetical protein